MRRLLQLLSASASLVDLAGPCGTVNIVLHLDDHWALDALGGASKVVHEVTADGSAISFDVREIRTGFGLTITIYSPIIVHPVDPALAWKAPAA
jgi:hypothetical protein